MPNATINIKSPKFADYQSAILNSTARFTITEASTKAGKTFSHIFWLFKEAHLGSNGWNYWWIAPIYSQAEIAFKRMQRKVAMLPQYIVNISKLSITTPIGTVLTFKSADNPDSLYGEDVYAFVFDEFSRAKEEAWFALRTTITYTNAKGKFIGNVVGKNWAYRIAQKAKSGVDTNYEYHKVTAYDAVKAGILKQEEVDAARIELPKRIFKMLYEAEIAEIEGALWSFELIEPYRVFELPELSRVVVAIDPAVTSKKESDETGIVVAAKGVDGHGYVLNDGSGTMTPNGWATEVVKLYHEYTADRAVGEVNNGGDLIENTLRNTDASISYKSVHATRGKVIRAEPIVALYERGLIHHYKTLHGLEDQMTGWDATNGDKSPDRVDALVWALTDLFINAPAEDFIL